MTQRSILVALLGSAAVLGALAARAHAGGMDVTLKVDERSADPKKNTPPDIVATVISGNAPPTVDKISLVETDDPMKKKEEIVMPATDVKTYVQGDDALGLVVVIETQHLWLGNDSWWDKNPASKTEGVYKALTGALDQFNAAGPAGSKGALITYGNGAETRWLGDLKDLTGDKIGTQKELTSTANPDGTLRANVGMDVSAGIDEAVSDLKSKMGPLSKKVLVLIGDGNNADPLADQKKQLANEGITAYAIYIQAPSGDLPGDANGWKKLTGNVKTLDSADGIKTAIGNIVAQCSDRYYVRFAGADLKLMKSFYYDDKPHSFSLRGIEKNDTEVPNDLPLPMWKAPWLQPKGGFPWWILGAALGGLLALILLIAVVFKKKQPAPQPVVAAPVIAAPVAAPAPAPAPAGPMKTVMIGIGGDDQGFPIVGWIVPLNGPNQFQTFKLQAGATKIGTGGASHIVINDGFMSTEHCQIVMSPAGFTLVDGGSTNGTQVNERKVDKHELVDNDVIMMGKTSFRFKSIN